MGIRNVRPAWVRVSLDKGGSNDPQRVAVGKGGTGPKSRSGTLLAEFLTRRDGAAVPHLTVEAIGTEDGSAVVWRILDASGAVVWTETVPQ